MPFCGNCGSEVTGGFCAKCGTPLAAAGAPSPAPGGGPQYAPGPVGGSPSAAGLMALIVQKTGQRQGNANIRFYQLGNAQYGFAGPAVLLSFIISSR